MKKRSRKNDAVVAAAKKQAASNADNVKPLVEPGIDDLGGYYGFTPICLTLFDHRVDDDLAGCDLTPHELRTLRRKSKDSGLPIGGLLRSAIDWLLTENLSANVS